MIITRFFKNISKDFNTRAYL